MSDGETEPIPWDELTRRERRNFARMLNQRFGASLSVDDAEEFYGAPEKVEQEFGDAERNPQGAPECPACFTPFFKDDIPYLKRTGLCPNCGEVLV